ADAKDQLAAAATELIERPVLDVVSDSPGDHETYGVIEPDPEKVKVGMTGVGQLVEIRDASGNKLARLIVGKEDKRPAGAGPSSGRSLRFVRRAGQDRVYRVELDTSKFTTKFDDWIEKDLLKISPWDVRRLTLDDSSCTFGMDEASGRPTISLDRRVAGCGRLLKVSSRSFARLWRPATTVEPLASVIRTAGCGAFLVGMGHPPQDRLSTASIGKPRRRVHPFPAAHATREPRAVSWRRPPPEERRTSGRSAAWRRAAAWEP
ncbi:MAG: DUF4340 domain-containing protein, partial [Planctomycetia bacterium]|nr:DUF4340 domain-containing protein [Planctomycetia bacterium]